MINILLDENIPFDLIILFEKFLFNVYHIKKLGKTGIKNGEVYKLANELEAWIITRDSDFESIIKFEDHQPKGVLVLKVKETKTHFLISLFKLILEKKTIKFDEQHLFVLTDETLRTIL